MGRIVITGATGFIGQHLTRRLAAAGHALCCLMRDGSTPRRSGEHLRWIAADLRDPATYRDSLRDADCVIHLAGVIDARRIEEYRATNVEATASLLRACRSVGAPRRRFLFMSSIAAMGPSYTGELLRESLTCRPETEYGRSKAEAEGVCLAQADALPTVILRPSFVYGPRDYRGLRMLDALLGHAPSPWPQGVRTLSLCHVSDLVDACVASLARDVRSGDTFLISDPTVHTWDTIRAALIDALDELLPGWPRRSPDSGSAPRTFLVPAQGWACDVRHAVEGLGFRARVPLAVGVRNTIGWYLREGLLSGQLAGPDSVTERGAVT
jgi:nucleoside-diphosphate-sugar epimerase